MTYVNFECRVRLNTVMSSWYRMEIGIHQGGFLSLLKYAAFIDPLLRKIENSNLGCVVHGIQTSPVGFADDMSACTLSKFNMDKVLNLVYQYSCKWGYKYNAKKSAVMVYGESQHFAKRNSKDRTFRLGKEKVLETKSYDHVGVKACLFNDFF